MISLGFALLTICALTGAYRPRLDGRIVGGRDVDITEFPHQLSMEYYGSHICGASIISPFWVLTASHCVDGTSARAIAFRAGSTSRGSGGSVHQATEIIMHPQYDDLDYDFALVRVSTPFPIGSSKVNAIELTAVEPKSGKMTVSGWGTTSAGGSSPRNLKAVDVNMVSRVTCQKAYGTISERMICAADSGKDSCQGDSGGPLINHETNIQVGVVSWGRGCASPGYPGVYSNIASVRAWIKKTTGV